MAKNKKNIIRAVSYVLSFLLLIVIFVVGRGYYKTKSYKETPLNLPAAFTITAHTGCMGTDDNSLKSMSQGRKNGASIVEFDLNFSPDGTPVLSHDKPVGGEVSLEDAFRYLASKKNLRANIDVKSTTNLEVVQILSSKYQLNDRVFFTGVDSDTMSFVKTECPSIAYYYNIDVEKRKNTNVDYLTQLVKTVDNSGAIGINMNKDAASAELVSAFHESNLLVSIYTVDSDKDMYKILSFAPDNITTRNPDRLSEIITEMTPSESDSTTAE